MRPISKTEEDIEWAMDRLGELVWMEGFPKEETHLRMIAKAWLDIVGAYPEVWTVIPDPESPDGTKRIMALAARSRDETADYLLSRVIAVCHKFPAPIVMRRLLSEPVGDEPGYGKPADGIWAAELEIDG